MALKAIIPRGQTAITVNGLHQWDYGQELEIYSEAIQAALVQVHFSCPGMKEAIVRTCNTVGSSLVVAIPDHCLEQTAPITAWVYELGETSGMTTITITLTVIPRARPQMPPTEGSKGFTDMYTDAVNAINGAVESAVEEFNAAVESGVEDINRSVGMMAEGLITAAEAKHAKNADIAKEVIFASGASPFEALPDASTRYLTDSGFYCITYQYPESDTKLVGQRFLYWERGSSVKELIGFPVLATSGTLSAFTYLIIKADGGLELWRDYHGAEKYSSRLDTAIIRWTKLWN